MSTTPPELRELHERLHAATPVTYPGLDLEAVVGQGRRTVRRRRLGAVVVAAVVAGIVAVGGTLLTGGLPQSSPVPAGPSGGATGGKAGGATSTATVTVPGTSGGDRVFLVSLTPDGASDLRVTYAEQTPSGTQQLGGSGVSELDRRITWGHGGTSPVIIGLLPSATAQQRLIVTADRDYGGYTTAVSPVTGTDWSAFVVLYSEPVTSDDPVQDILWFDATGRPVDRDGRVGSVAKPSAGAVWITADGTSFGTDEAATPASTTGIPSIVSGGDASVTTETWRISALAPAGAVSGTLRLVDGRAVPFTAVPLGPDHAAVSVTVQGPKNAGPTVASMTWRDASGATHERAR